ncbi:MAG: response regulator [Cyanobacteria bacterium P01_A01_bin.114]
MRILLIEDDEILSGVLVKTLTEQRYVLDVAEDGQLGLEYAQAGAYDLILLDVGLPHIDGISLCKQLRSEGCVTPLLLMTAGNAPEERIRGLDAGADDYLTKPLDLAELQARIRALLRRGEVTPTSILEIGQLRLDPVSCVVTCGGDILKLTPKEYSLLELFLRNPARVFSRGQIIEHLWSFEDPPLEDSVKAHIKGLRRKLKKAGAQDWIENVYGLGYKLKPPVSVSVSDTAAAQPDAKPDAKVASDAGAQTSTPKPAAEQSFNQAMEALWRQYKGLMQARLHLLTEAVSAIENTMLGDELRQQAGQAAHKLAGVLGMFNREAGTGLARQLETILLEQPTIIQLAKVPDLVRELAENLDLTALPLPATEPPLEERLLLIGADRSLGVELQQLTQTSNLGWFLAPTLAEAKNWLQTHAPEVVVFDLADIDRASTSQAGTGQAGTGQAGTGQAGTGQAGIDRAGTGQANIEQALPLLADLAARTPAIPTVVLTGEDNLSGRVQMAAVGAQVLTQPVSVAQTWAVANGLRLRRSRQTMHVLAIDDDPILLKALRPLIEPWGMRLTTSDQPLQFWQVLTDSQPDLLILDVEMPDFNGIELCQAVRSDPRWQDLPIVFLTSHTDAKTVQQIFTAGADDYVTKPLLGPELMTRITNRLERNRLLTALSSVDSKTGLANYPQSSQQLGQLIAQAKPFAIAVLHLEGLSDINLTYGHITGQQILQRWGSLLQAHLGTAALLGYWEEGDFMIVLSDLRKADAKEQLEPVLQLLRQQIFTAPDGQRLQANYRVGIAEYPGDAQTQQQLYQIAVKTSKVS